MAFTIESINTGSHWKTSWWAGGWLWEETFPLTLRQRGSALRDGNIAGLMSHLLREQPDIQFLHQVRREGQIDELLTYYADHARRERPSLREYTYHVSGIQNGRYSAVLIDKRLAPEKQPIHVSGIPLTTEWLGVANKILQVVDLGSLVVASAKLTAGIAGANIRDSETGQIMTYLTNTYRTKPTVLLGPLNYVREFPDPAFANRDPFFRQGVDRLSREKLHFANFHEVPLGSADPAQRLGTTRDGKYALDYAYCRHVAGSGTFTVLPALPEHAGTPPIASRPVRLVLENMNL
jgi:hypothetical protein